MPSSDSGVSKTRSAPNWSCSPRVVPNIADGSSTPWPSTKTAGSLVESNRQRLMDCPDVADDAAFGGVGGVIDERIDESFIPGHLHYRALPGSVVRDPSLASSGRPEPVEERDPFLLRCFAASEGPFAIRVSTASVGIHMSREVFLRGVWAVQGELERVRDLARDSCLRSGNRLIIEQIFFPEEMFEQRNRIDGLPVFALFEVTVAGVRCRRPIRRAHAGGKPVLR